MKSEMEDLDFNGNELIDDLDEDEDEEDDEDEEEQLEIDDAGIDEFDAEYDSAEEEDLG
ncbi:hypothetical protein [Paenibacillus sp. KN14-4R]|uniref:hypothetical protein n=1 Tax=Paenibacillus sp. KN14-4R TaxID=3445773 RepID=UPI003FA12B3F